MLTGLEICCTNDYSLMEVDLSVCLDHAGISIKIDLFKTMESVQIMVGWMHFETASRWVRYNMGCMVLLSYGNLIPKVESVNSDISGNFLMI